MLELSGLDAGLVRFSFSASASGDDQLEHGTDITSQSTVVVSNLGWGVPGMVVTRAVPSSWHGLIRARPTPPAAGFIRLQSNEMERQMEDRLFHLPEREGKRGLRSRAFHPG